MNNQKIKQEIISHIGSNVGTIYGLSLVVGIFKEGEIEYVHMKESGVEDYYIELKEWEDLKI